MAFEIRKSAPIAFPKRKPAKSKDYLSFLHKLPSCAGPTHPVEAAHVSFAAPQYGHYGRSKGTKAPDRWALPLHPDEHRCQHNGSEREYWASVGINPAIRLSGLETQSSAPALKSHSKVDRLTP